MGLACRHADLIMCLSQPVKEDFTKLNSELRLKGSVPQVVGCCLDFSELDRVPEEKVQFDIVFLGRMHEQKGVFDLPEVWAAIIAKRPESRMIVIGEGPH